MDAGASGTLDCRLEREPQTLHEQTPPVADLTIDPVAGEVMDRLIERCTMPDVHRDTVVACVRLPDQDGGSQELRMFGTIARQLLTLRDWLASHQVTVVAMESTSIYWKSV